MQVTMLGSDYAYANTMLGADTNVQASDSTKIQSVLTQVLGMAKDTAIAFLNSRGNQAASQGEADGFAKAIALIQATGSVSAAQNAAKGGFNWQANTPWLIIGGVGIVALLFLAGTRKRR